MMKRALMVLVVAPWALALSRGFGAGPAKKKGATKKQKKPEIFSSSVIETPAVKETVDKWGLPLDFDERAEDKADPMIGARCVAVERLGESPSSLWPLTSSLADDGETGSVFVPERQLLKNESSWARRLEVLHVEPLVIRVRGLLSSDECERLAGLSSTTRAKEMAKDAGTFSGSQASRRTSTTWYARFQEPEVAPLVARAAKLFGADWTFFEEVQIARYQAGERFRWHEDAVPPSLLSPGGSDGGQRIATLLVYLSDDFQGGSTTFRDLAPLRSLRPPLKVQPKKGDALIFFPAKRHKNKWRPDDRTIHAADPVATGAGEKWVSQLWLHEAPYPPTIFKHDNPRHPHHAQSVLPTFQHPPP